MKNLTLTTISLLFVMAGFAAPPVINNISPGSGARGTRVVITGTGFTGATAVYFGGTPAAAFTVVSNTMINALVGTGGTGAVQVTVGSETGSISGFTYLSSSRIITDFGGYWSSATPSNNSVQPDSSHNLLAFTYGGNLYSTGVNDALLQSKGHSFIPGTFEALPVNSIVGTNGTGAGGGTSTYLALGKKTDGSAGTANTPAVSNFTIRKVMVDGKSGLDLGTGITNLPVSAVMTFQVYNMNPGKVADGEPDLILTQIADPSAGNDVFSFLDASGNVVGNAVTEDMTLLPSYGTYQLDLFNLTPNTPYNVATAYSAASTNTTRNIRLVGLQLSNFGITPANANQVASLQIRPSGASDYAFIAYNVGALNLIPSVIINTVLTETTICTGGRAAMAVTATPARGGALSYIWQESTDGGSNWNNVTDGGNYSGATIEFLTVTNPINTNQYRVIVTEAGNVKPAISSVFTIKILTNPPTPTAALSSYSQTTCLNTAIQLSSVATGSNSLDYQWQTDASGTFQNIPHADFSTYVPPVDRTGVTRYRVMVADGSGCPYVTTNPVTVTVTGIESVTPATVCQNTAAILQATATTGMANWYTSDTASSPIANGNSYTTPALATTTTYYIGAAGCPLGWRKPVTASVIPATVAGMVTSDTIVLPGTNQAALTLKNYTGSILKWQSSTDAFKNQITDIANTTDNLLVNNLTKTTHYRALVQNSSCSSLYATMATVIVGGVLPIQTGSVTVTPEGHSLRVKWTAYDQQKTAAYEVERSLDGVHFLKVYSAAPTTASEATYQWLDIHPAQGHSFYRIKEIATNGNFGYSTIVWATLETNELGITILGNPVKNKTLGLQFNNIGAGKYQARVVTVQGQLVYSTILSHGGGTARLQMLLPASLHNGLYKLEILAPDKTHRGFSIVVL